MKKMIGSMIAVAGLAAAAHAQPLATQLKYEVRAFNAGNDLGWASSMDALPGSRVEVRALVSYTGTGTVGGLGQIVFQPIVSAWGAGDVLMTNDLTGQTGPVGGIGPVGGTRSTPIGTVDNLPGVYGRITPWGANATTTSTFLRGHVGTGTAAGMLRIAQNHITNWIGVGATSGSTSNNNVNGGGGVSIAQIANPARLPSDPAFDNRSSNIVVFKSQRPHAEHRHPRQRLQPDAVQRAVHPQHSLVRQRERVHAQRSDRRRLHGRRRPRGPGSWCDGPPGPGRAGRRSPPSVSNSRGYTPL
jgi:hypothetical protein